MHATLIDTPTLARNNNPRSWRVVDCRAALDDPGHGRRSYAEGHIPHAVHADLETELSGPVIPGRTGRHPLPERDQLAARFASWGISNSTQIVAYDAGNGAFAARLWWLARWLGHAAVAVLDGGLAAWTAAGNPLTTRVESFQKTGFVARAPLTRTVNAAGIQAGGTSLTLIDARAQARYRGEHEPIDPVAGHIPGAVCMPFEGNLGATARWLTAPELAERYAGLDGAAVVAYCGSGVTACHNILAMKHAGLPEPALYPGSWSEWITDPSRPVAR